MNNSVWAKLALSGVITVGTAGCAYVYGPAERKMAVAEACTPALAEYHCAPAPYGPRIVLDEAPQTLTLDEQGNPRVLDYLGTVVGIQNRSGAPGNNCANLSSTPFTTASWALETRTDTGGDIERTVTQTYTLRREVGAQAKVNLASAIEQAGVPRVVVDRLQGDIDLTIGRLESAKVEATGTFRQYQLRNDLIRAMNAGAFSDDLIRSILPGASAAEIDQRRAMLASCRAQLVGSPPAARMYRAITGFHVRSYEASSSTVDTIVATLAARVKAVEPSVDMAALNLSLKSVATTSISTSMRPIFVVSGVSFWSPELLSASSE